MIIPIYSENKFLPPNEPRFYAYTHIDVNGIIFSRYLTPTGWSRKCHYFASLAEVEDMFNKIQAAIMEVPPVLAPEYESEVECREVWRRMQEESFHRYMREAMNNNIDTGTHNP